MSQKNLNSLPAVAPEGATPQGGTVFRAFLIGIAVVGCLFLALALLKPHQTGVVVSVGHVSSYTARTGRGIHASKHRRYAADVRVRVAGSANTETVYYRVGRVEALPSVGDEVTFADSFLVGNTPYPQMWAVRMGLLLLGLDLAALIVFLFLRHGRAPHG